MSLHKLSIAVACVLTAGAAQALPFNGNFEVVANATDPGLVVDIDPSGLAPFSFGDLAVGDMAVIDLFTISTSEASVNAGEDTVAKPISVAFSFVSPSANGSIGGVTQGVRLFFGTVQFGAVTWGAPLELTFGQGGKATLGLLDATFGGDLGGLSDKSAIVQAKLSYDVAPVPVPAAAGLLAAGLAGLGVFGARRRRAA